MSENQIETFVQAITLVSRIPKLRNSQEGKVPMPSGKNELIKILLYFRSALVTLLLSFLRIHIFLAFKCLGFSVPDNSQSRKST